MRTAHAHLLVLSTAIAAAAPAFAQEMAKVAIVRTGGGILAADGVSVVPLELVVQKRGKVGIRNARITAAAGKISAVRVIDGERVAFLYTVPKKPTAEETLEVTLETAEGERSDTFPLVIPAPDEPELDLLVEPAVLSVAAKRDNKPVSVAATASGGDLEGLGIIAAPGTTSPIDYRTVESSLRAFTNVDTSAISNESPAYVLVVAATASDKGFAAKTSGVATEAAIRVSVDIPPRSVLSIEGAAIDPEPVTAAADGRTVMEDVIVRYGARVRAFAKRGGKRNEVSIVVPSTAALAVVLPIPGQAYADGGVGPTLVVAAPPAPFGGEPLWPEVEIEGVEIIQTIKLAPDLRALVLQRPREATSAAILFDEEPAGRLYFQPLRGEALAVATTYTKTDERGALEVLVKDSAGELTDTPVPRVRLSSGKALPMERQGTGKYRVSLPLSVEGATGATVDVIAEMDPPPLVSGDPMQPITTIVKIGLKGPPAPVRAGGDPPDPPKQTVKTEPEAPKAPDDGVWFGLTGSALVGTTFTSLIVVGGSVMAEVRPPVVDRRLAFRAGIEFAHASGSGTVEGFDGVPPESRTTIAGFLFPFDIGFAAVRNDDFELLVRAGAALRLESGAIEVAGARPGGGNRTGFGVHAAIEAAFSVGSGALVLGATLGGIGASADGFSAGGTQISGGLMSVRADAGYRLWF